MSSSHVKRYQWMRNAEGGQSFGNRMEIRLLSEEAFQRFVAPCLRNGYANSLMEYQLKHPEQTHYSVFMRENDSEWQFVEVGKLIELEKKAKATGWSIEVDDFQSKVAISFGERADTNNV